MNDDSLPQSPLIDHFNGMEEHESATEMPAIMNSPALDEGSLQSIVSDTNVRALYDSKSRIESEDEESGDVNAAASTSNGDCNRAVSILRELASACGSLLQDPRFKENFEQALLRALDLVSTNSTDELQNGH